MQTRHILFFRTLKNVETIVYAAYYAIITFLFMQFIYFHLPSFSLKEMQRT